MWEKIDEYIMSRLAEPMLWHLQYRYGLKHWEVLFAIYWGIILVGVAYRALFVGFLNQLHMITSFFLLGLAAALFLLLKKVDMGSGTTMNPHRYHRTVRLIIGVVVIWVGVAGFVGNDSTKPFYAALFVFGSLAGMYIMGANGLPPGVRKAKEARDALRHGVSQAK